MTLAVVKMENKSRTSAKLFLILARAAPLRTAMGIQAKMKNLYMSQEFGVIEIRLGARNSITKTIFRKVPLIFFMKIKESKNGTPRFAI